MRLPKPLLRYDSKAHKSLFGHVLVLAGSPSMLGAATLTALAAMRAGAGLVTCCVPKSLNLTLQKKLSPVIMTLPLPETRDGTLSLSAYPVLKGTWDKFSAVALGPGLSRNAQTQKCIIELIQDCPKPMVIDADALAALPQCQLNGRKNNAGRVLTPHEGEMAKLMGCSREFVKRHRRATALNCAKKYGSIVVLKGRNSIIATPDGKASINRTGNVGMATAGSGDVLTGMIAALLAQGVAPFEASAFGAHWHGRAGDLAIKKIAPASLIATDLIDNLSRLKGR